MESLYRSRWSSFYVLGEGLMDGFDILNCLMQLDLPARNRLIARIIFLARLEGLEPSSLSPSYPRAKAVDKPQRDQA